MKFSVLTSCLIWVVMAFQFSYAQSPVNIPRSNNPLLPQSPPISGSPSVSRTALQASVPAPAPRSAMTASPFGSGMTKAAIEAATPEQIAASSFVPAAPSPEGGTSMIPQQPAVFGSSAPFVAATATPPMTSAIGPLAGSPTAVVNGNLCRAGISIGQVWHVNSTSGEDFVVYIYLTAGSDQAVNVPWKFEVNNPNYADFVSFWNIGTATTSNGSLTGQVPQNWQTLQPAAINVVDVGFVAHSLMNLSSNSDRVPTTVKANDIACEIYNYS